MDDDLFQYAQDIDRCARDLETHPTPALVADVAARLERVAHLLRD